MLSRMLGAARFNVATFEEVENDSAATKQAMIVVILVSIAGAIGGLSGGVLGSIAGLIFGLIQWAAWAGVTYLIGTTIFKTPETHADWGELARTTGFAQTPGLLKAFSLLPAVGPLILLVATIWQVVAMVIGVRQALDYQSTWRAIGVVVIGALIVVIPLGILRMIIDAATGG